MNLKIIYRFLIPGHNHSFLQQWWCLNLHYRTDKHIIKWEQYRNTSLPNLQWRCPSSSLCGKFHPQPHVPFSVAITPSFVAYVLWVTDLYYLCAKDCYKSLVYETPLNFNEWDEFLSTIIFFLIFFKQVIGHSIPNTVNLSMVVISVQDIKFLVLLCFVLFGGVFFVSSFYVFCLFLLKTFIIVPTRDNTMLSLKYAQKNTLKTNKTWR